MGVRIAINGFGRVGRLVLRGALSNKSKTVNDISWVAVNDVTSAETLAHLFTYDSTFGRFSGEVKAAANKITVDGMEIEVVSIKEPKELPWKKLAVDYVVESTGKFTDAEKAKAHLEAGAKRVIITAPAKSEDITVCMGVNEDKYDPAKHFVMSNASCTTNCLAPMAKVLHETFTIDRGFMVTIHAFTNDQPILDFPHKDLRRARSAGMSIIPTTTGAAKAIGLVIPELLGKLNGLAIRVPTPDVSLVCLSAQVSKPTGKEEVNKTFQQAAGTQKLGKYLAYNNLPLVSKDFQGNPASCIFDATMTEVIDGTLVNIFGWYDNEWGYANRVIDLVDYLASREPKPASRPKTAKTTK